MLLEIEFNPNGTINAASTENNKRVNVWCRESDTVQVRLAQAKTRGRVKLGEIAVFKNREFMRVPQWKFGGAAWIEVQEKESTRAKQVKVKNSKI